MSAVCCGLNMPFTLNSVLSFAYRSLMHMAQPKTYSKRRNMGIGWKCLEPIAITIYLQFPHSRNLDCIVVSSLADK